MKLHKRNWMALAAIALITVASVWQFWPLEQKITQGLDIKGGLSVILTAQPLSSGGALTEDTMERVETILVERVNGFGVSEASVQRQGQNAFLVQLPGIQNARDALALLGEPGRLEFIELASITDTATVGLIYQQIEADRAVEPTDTVAPLDENTYEPFMTGEVITDARVVTDEFGNPAVSVTMSQAGANTWAEVTRRLAPTQGQVVIALDGRAKSAPNVQEPILTGDTQISGAFTVDEAKGLAAVLQSGAMPAEIVIDESRVVGPTLGQESLNQGLMAGLIGLAFVAAFMVLYYRGLGLVSWASLALYGAMFLGVLAVLSRLNAFSMTLPGIAGIILTIGVAADTSILIYERLQEEVRAGKTLRSAAKSGVRHAIATSIDADVVTLVSAVALYAFAIGPVRGFAFTLILGIILDLVVAILFTGPVVRMLAEGTMTKWPSLFGMKQSIAQRVRRGFDFMGKRKIFFSVSGALTVLAIVALLVKGLTFGIEFQGGTVMTLTGAGGISTEQMREALTEAGAPDAQNAAIQPTDDGGFIVRTSESDTAAAQRVFGAVVTQLELPDQDVNVTTIGPGWGMNVTNAALIALAISIIAILGYISLRFEYKMSIVAVVALVHDALIVLGIYALAGLEVTPNTIAALLTILGYSLYDTIVVFHRIKENASGLSKRSFMEMTNDSINQMLMRWVNTGLVQIIPVFALLFFGGETLRDFAFAMSIGLMAGVYSSVGLASPLYAVWKEREPKFQALKRKYAQQNGK